LPKFSDWPEEKESHAEYISLYPNVLLGLQVDHAFAIILDPVSPGKTIERLELQFVGKSAIEQAFVECRDAVLSAWQEVFAEDIFAVEGMQRGRLSPAFKGGLFSPVLDESTHHFHLWLAHQYRADYVRA
jgi:choline monooxygenase